MTLCDWLDLPRVAIVDCSRLNDCQLPGRPGRRCSVAGSSDQRMRRASLADRFGIAVGHSGGRRDAATRRCCAKRWRRCPSGQKPPRELCSALGQEFLRHSRLERLLRLASRRGIPGDWAVPARKIDHAATAARQSASGRGVRRRLPLLLSRHARHAGDARGDGARVFAAARRMPAGGNRHRVSGLRPAAGSCRGAGGKSLLDDGAEGSHLRRQASVCRRGRAGVFVPARRTGRRQRWCR